MATEYHIHPELTIMLNGKEVLVPHNVGIQPTCMTSIHTHDEPHVLHVEAPVKRDFTLGDFFAVWQKDFSSTKLLDNTVGEGSEIVVTVNGEKVNTYENTILRDKDKIIITYQ
jgi:sulfur carrier protein ThiS